jgi:L-amino acid N-acyltransferase YncA
MEIRDLQHKDFEGIINIIYKIYDTNSFCFWFNKRPSKKELRTIFDIKIEACILNKGIDKVATENNKVIGECEIMLVDGTAKIGIIVEPDYQKKGIGKKLLYEAMKNLKKIGMKLVYAEISEFNTDAIHFFESANFSRIDKNHDQSKNKTFGNIIIMKKFI